MSEDRSEQDPPRAKDDEDDDDVKGHSHPASLSSKRADSGSTESSHPDEGNPNPVELRDNV